MSEHIETFYRLVNAIYEKGEITLTIRDFLLSQTPETHDDMLECYDELFRAIEQKDYYKLVERIEKGEKLMEVETDPAKREYYRTLLRALTHELEMILVRMQKGA